MKGRDFCVAFGATDAIEMSNSVSSSSFVFIFYLIN
jgi:hypothetical protein